MVTFLDSFISQLDTLNIKYYLDPDFGDDTTVLSINSEEKVGKHLTVGFIFKKSSGALTDVEFREETKFDGDFKVERKASSAEASAQAGKEVSS